MVGVEQLAAFTVVAVVVVAIPGPGVLFVVGNALARGRSAAVASVAGNALGSYGVALIVSLGVGRLLLASEPAFRALKYAGAAYLIFLGVRAMRDHRASVDARGVAGTRIPFGRALGRGVLVSVTNPKVFVLYAAILPQFVDRGQGSPTSQMLQLSVIVVLIGLITDTAWALAAGAARDWLARSPRRMRAIGTIGGASIAGLGLIALVANEPQGHS